MMDFKKESTQGTVKPNLLAVRTIWWWNVIWNQDKQWIKEDKYISFYYNMCYNNTN